VLLARLANIFFMLSDSCYSLSILCLDLVCVQHADCFWINMLLSVLSLSEPVKTAISAGVLTLEDLEDVFLDLGNDESKVRAMIELIVDESIVMHHAIRCIMFVFQWFMLNIADPYF
jgi:hypothetical protein